MRVCVWLAGFVVLIKSSPLFLLLLFPPRRGLSEKKKKKTAGNMNHCQVGPDEDTRSVSPEFTGLMWQPSCDPLSGTCHVGRVLASFSCKWRQVWTECEWDSSHCRPPRDAPLPPDEINTKPDIPSSPPIPGIVQNNEDFFFFFIIARMRWCEGGMGVHQ